MSTVLATRLLRGAGGADDYDITTGRFVVYARLAAAGNQDVRARPAQLAHLHARLSRLQRDNPIHALA